MGMVWPVSSDKINGNRSKFCKAIVLAVLHHFCVPVTLQSQNYINVNNPIKMMANFQVNFPTSVPKTLICWKKMKVIIGAECNIAPNNNLICWLILADHQIKSFKSFYSVNRTIDIHIHFCLRYKFSWSVWLWSLFKAHSFTLMVDSTRKKKKPLETFGTRNVPMNISYNCSKTMLQLCNTAEKSDVRLTVKLRSDMQSTLMSRWLTDFFNKWVWGTDRMTSDLSETVMSRSVDSVADSLQDLLAAFGDKISWDTSP